MGLPGGLIAGTLRRLGLPGGLIASTLRMGLPGGLIAGTLRRIGLPGRLQKLQSLCWLFGGFILHHSLSDHFIMKHPIQLHNCLLHRFLGKKLSQTRERRVMQIHERLKQNIIFDLPKDYITVLQKHVDSDGGSRIPHQQLAMYSSDRQPLDSIRVLQSR